MTTRKLTIAPSVLAARLRAGTLDRVGFLCRTDAEPVVWSSGFTPEQIEKMIASHGDTPVPVEIDHYSTGRREANIGGVIDFG